MSFTQEASGIDIAAHLIRNSHYCVALTGAGTSTPSDIPDFRSPGSGLWQRYDSMEVASLSAFRKDPQRFYDWVRPLAQVILQAQPNPAHLALAQLEKAGKLQAIITQNIDGLHQRAGSKRVFEVHGSLGTMTCIQCGLAQPSEPYFPKFIERGEIPRCPRCAGVLKPDVILFDELLPPHIWEQAYDHARRCDVMLVVGSSLEVLPVGGLPAEAVRRGAALIINNRQPTHMDRQAAVLLRGDLAQVVPAIVKAVSGIRA